MAVRYRKSLESAGLLPGSPDADFVEYGAAHPMTGDASSKSRLRKHLKDQGYSEDAVDALVPKKRAGRPSAPGGAPLPLLSGPARTAITQAIGADYVDELDRLDSWDITSLSEAVDALRELYPNAHSLALAYNALIRSLRAIGVDEDLLTLVGEHNTDIYADRQAVLREKLKEKAAKFIPVPAPWQDLDAFKARLDAFLAGGDVTPQTFADIRVLLSARPGELESLRLGPTGKVSGVLKKRAEHRDTEYDLISMYGPEYARDVLTAWQALPEAVRKQAGSPAAQKALRKEFKFKSGDLRALGAQRAAESVAATQSTEPTAAAIEGARRVALRHGAPGASIPSEHYASFAPAPATIVASAASQDTSAIDDMIAQLQTLRAARAARQAPK